LEEKSIGWGGDPALRDRAKITSTLRVDVVTNTFRISDVKPGGTISMVDRYHVRGIVYFSISCAVLFACVGAAAANPHSNGAPDVVRLGREYKLKAGRQVTGKGTRLRIRFVTVENDSRCPSDVTCVWAGNAAVQLQFGTGRSSKTITLNTSKSPSFVGETEYHGYRVTLVDLSPYPRSDRKIARRDYIATLLVSKE
jgi:hypothetical protein